MDLHKLRISQIQSQRDQEDLFGFEEMNAVKSKASGVPQIGIWWAYKGQIITMSHKYEDGGNVKTRDKENVMKMNTTFYNNIGSHQTYWRDAMVKNFPELLNKSYMIPPRGRIDISKGWNRDLQVSILCSKEFAALGESHSMVRALLKSHNCSGLSVVFNPDGHYGTSNEVFKSTEESF